jgi:hypothetical protein
MDDLKIRYGFYTTYEAIVFLKRASDKTFEVSRPILYSTASTESGGEGGISVREYFLYLASLANSDMYCYLNTYGKSLVSHLL